MEGFFSPESLTGVGAFLTLALFNAIAYIRGWIYSASAVQDMRKQYEARLTEMAEVRDMWRNAYYKEVAAKDLRWSAVGSMMIEQSKTIGHTLESIQEEARKHREEADVPPTDTTEPPAH